jgi:hypothetical protein
MALGASGDPAEGGELDVGRHRGAPAEGGGGLAEARARAPPRREAKLQQPPHQRLEVVGLERASDGPSQACAVPVAPVHAAAAGSGSSTAARRYPTLQTLSMIPAGAPASSSFRRTREACESTVRVRVVAPA